MPASRARSRLTSMDPAPSRRDAGAQPLWQLLGVPKTAPGARCSLDDLARLAYDGVAGWTHPAIPIVAAFIERVAVLRENKRDITLAQHYAVMAAQSTCVDLRDCPVEMLRRILDTDPPAGTLCRLAEHPNADVALWQTIARRGRIGGEQLCFYLAGQPAARADRVISQEILREFGALDSDPVRAVLERCGSRQRQFRGPVLAALVADAPFPGADGLFAFAVHQAGHLVAEIWDAASPAQRGALTPSLVTDLLMTAAGPAREALLTTVIPTLLRAPAEAAAPR